MVGINHATQVSGSNNPNKQVSATAWNEDHAVFGSAGKVLGFDSTGAASEVSAALTVATRGAFPGLESGVSAVYLTESGREGLFVWSGSNSSTQVSADPEQGIYVAAPEDGTGASGAWVRKYDGPINAAWFGTDSAAMSAVQTYVASLARSGYGYNKGMPQVAVPFDVVDFTAAFDVTWPIHWIAQGDGGGSNAATVLAWNNASSGLRIQYVDTTGDSGTQSAATHSGSGAIFEGFHLDGGFSSGTEAERHAVHARAKVLLRNCNFFNWAGDAIYIDASTVGVRKGNANLVKTENCWAENCRNGWTCAGNDDTNAGHLVGFSANICRRWGVLESSFLGNQIFGGHFDSNARTSWNTGATNHPCSYVSIGGWQYFAIHGQETGASTNAPKSSTVTITIASPGVVTWNSHGLSDGDQVAFSTTGALPTGLAISTAYYVVNSAANTFQVSATLGGSAINTSGSQSGTHTSGAGKDNTYWGSWQAGGTATGVPLWTNGIVVRSGGPILITGANNATTVFGPHVETNGVSQIDSLASWFGGNSPDGAVVKVVSGALNRNRVPRIRPSDSGLWAEGNWNIRGALLAGNAFNTLGPIGTTAQDGTTVFGTRSTQHTIQYSVLDQYGTVVSSWFTSATGSGFGRSNDFNAGLFDRWKFNSVEVLKVDSTGLQIGQGTALSKVVAYAPSLTPSSVAAATVAEQTFTVSGLTTADKVIVNPPSISNATGIAGARVSAADTLAIRFVNPTAGALTPSSGTYTVIAIRS